MLLQLWHLWVSSYAPYFLPLDDSTTVDDGPTPLPTSPVLILDGQSAMNALCWTKRCVIVSMATSVCEMFPPIGGCYMGGTSIHRGGQGPSTGLHLACSRSWADLRPAT